MRKKVIAILCADLHLSHRPPVWRSNEPNWYNAMGYALSQIQNLIATHPDSIVLCAGDVFDRWNSPPELTNFAITKIPRPIYGIPGQHDMPNHNRNEMNRSAYNTLIWSGVMRGLPFGASYYPRKDRSICVHSFPYGIPINRSSIQVDEAILNVALVHDYVWYGQHKYPDAPKEAKLKTNTKLIKGKLYGYDVIVYGDNHKGFLTKVGKTTVFNCGTLMRRKSDEADYKPQVGLLYSDGSVELHYLDTSLDAHLTVDQSKYIEAAEAMDGVSMKEFAAELRELGSTALCFEDAIKKYCRKQRVVDGVYKLIRQAMEIDDDE